MMNSFFPKTQGGQGQKDVANQAHMQAQGLKYTFAQET
jgi:hypothetical protein